MNEFEMMQIFAVIVAGAVSPIYGLLFWRIRVSSRVEKKLSKLCMAFKLEHPKYKELLD